MKPYDSFEIWKTIVFLINNYHVEVFIEKDLIVLHSIDKFNEYIIPTSKSTLDIQTELEKATIALTLRRDLKLVKEC